MNAPKKSLGQNFLQDEKVLAKIVETAELSNDDNVFEIGPGKGALTRELVKFAGKVLAVEKDCQLVGKLLDEFEEKAGVVSGDILEINLPKILEQNGFENYKLVANIPYYITGKILRTFLELENKPELIILLVQKEVAERVCAADGKESILSISIKYFGEPEVVDYVSKESFYPVPKVDSAILKIKPFDNSRVASDCVRKKKFFRLVKIGFSSKRKTLINNLSAGLQISKSELAEIFEKLSLDEKIRAENLSVEDWEKLRKLLNSSIA